MQKRKVTVVTQLHEEHNADLMEYIDASRNSYAKAVRETFYCVKMIDNSINQVIIHISKLNMILLAEPRVPSFQMHRGDTML